jgi:hypothetical protein
MSKPTQTYQDGLYRRLTEIKIVKTQYGLVVGVGATAKQIKEAIAKIPDDARVVDEDDAQSETTRIKGTIYIFEVEKVDSE